MMNKIRKHIKECIEEATGLQAAFVRANDQMQYPYLTFEIRVDYSEDIDRNTYTVMVDGWDRNNVKALIEAFTKLDRKWKRYKELNDDFCMQIFNGGTGEFVDDEDRTIRHYLRTYDMIIHERK